MTTLNWERDRARHQPREFAFDDLPRTGSWADQMRYLSRDAGPCPRGLRTKPISSGRTRGPGFAQLGKYVEHASQLEFKRKASIQQQEIISILRKLIGRCVQWECTLAGPDLALLSAARRIVAEWPH